LKFLIKATQTFITREQNKIRKIFMKNISKLSDDQN